MQTLLASPYRIKQKRRRRRKIVSVRQHYNYFRDYEAATGRYVQSDPVGLEGGLSTYAYVESSPIDSFDDQGLQRRTINPRGRWSNPIGRRPLEPMSRNAIARMSGSSAIHRYYITPNTSNSCGTCIEILAVVPVRGVTRFQHRYYGNQMLLNNLTLNPAYNQTLSGALGVANVAAQMRSGSSQLINPTGTEWHHQAQYPNAVWLVRQCDHRNTNFQEFLHPFPNGAGGFSVNFK
jgi:RHS repeat-associated protein